MNTAKNFELSEKTSENIELSPNSQFGVLQKKIEQTFSWFQEIDRYYTEAQLSSQQQKIEQVSAYQEAYRKHELELGQFLYDLIETQSPEQIMFSITQGLKTQLPKIEPTHPSEEQNRSTGHLSEPKVIVNSEPVPVATHQLKHYEPVDSLPENLSIGTRKWSLSEAQINRINQPTFINRPPKNKLKFETSEIALNHLIECLNQDLTDQKFAYELEQVLKHSPLKSDDSRLCELLADIDIPDGKVFRKLRRSIRAYHLLVQDELSVLDTPSQAWPFAEHFSGKSIKLIGGTPRIEIVDRLKQVLPHADIEWIEAENGLGLQQLKSLERSAKAGSIDVFLLITAFMGHHISNRFMPLNHYPIDSHGRRIHVRLIRGGYGLAKLKLALLECFNSDSAQI